MKYEVTGIMKEAIHGGNSNVGPETATAASEPIGHMIVATLRLVDTDPKGPFLGIWIPYEMIQGAQVEDQFEVRFERLPRGINPHSR